MDPSATWSEPQWSSVVVHLTAIGWKHGSVHEVAFQVAKRSIAFNALVVTSLDDIPTVN